MKKCRKLLSVMLMLCLALSVICVNTLVVSANTNSLTLDFDKTADIVTDTASAFYWQTEGTNRRVPSLVTEDGMKQGKFEGPSSGTNYHNLVLSNSSLESDNYVVEMKVKRTTQDCFSVYIQGRDGKKIANYKIKGANSSIAYQAESGETFSNGNTYIDLSASNGVGAYDIVYLNVDTANDVCRLYVNSTAYSAEYKYTGTGALSFIRFDMENDTTADDSGVVYLDYIKIYPAADFVAPILNLEFDNDASIALRNKATWATSSRYTPEVVDANGLRAAKMYGNSSTTARMYQLGTSALSVSGDIVIETKVKFSSANEFNMCYTVSGTADGDTTAREGYLNLRTQARSSDGKTKTFYNATSGSNVSGAYYETDVIPAAADFNMGWNKIFIRLNTVTGAYTVYINDASKSSTGYMTNGTYGTIKNSKFTSLRFDCKSASGNEADTYIDYIKIYSASGWTAPASFVKDDVCVDFNNYEIGANAYSGLINYTNDDISAFSSEIASDPLNSQNKCLAISGTADKVLDIGVNSANAVIEYKVYLPQNAYCQAANILNTENNYYVASYNGENKTNVNFGSSFASISGSSYATVLDGWNTFKYIIDTNDANEYTLYTFVNSRFINKEKYAGTVKNLRMTIPRVSGVKIYIDDFSVKYNSGFDVTAPEVYKDGEKVTASTAVSKDDIAEVKYTSLNSGSENATKKVIFAVYKNSNGALSLAQATVIPDADTTYAKGFIDKAHNVSLETDVDFENGDIIKVFCWNDTNSVTPFTSAVEISK